MATIDGLMPSASTPRTLAPGLTCGPGDLPHLDLAAAASFGADASTIPTLPTLPRLAPSQSELHQGLVGIAGLRPGPYGTFSIDVNALDPDAPVDTDIDSPTFAGFVATLDRLRHRSAVDNVKWQIAGPVMIAEAIHRAGAEAGFALAVGCSAARQRLGDVSAYVSTVLPNARQLIVVDELDIDQWTMQRGLPLAECLDAVSSVLAVGEARGTVGVTGPAGASVTSLIETGPHIVGIRAGGMAQWAGRVARFVETGGALLWQVGRASGPMTEPQRRAATRLGQTVSVLAGAGIDLDRVAEQSIITTDGGLAGHDVTSAWHVMAALDRLSVFFASGSALGDLAAGSRAAP